jgi:hypothetical protein
VRGGRLDTSESISLDAVTRPRYIAAISGTTDDHSFSQTKSDFLNTPHPAKYQPRISPGDVSHNSKQSTVEGPTALEHHHTGPSNVHDDSERSSRTMRPHGYAESIQTTGQGLLTQPDSIHTEERSLSLTSDPEYHMELTLNSARAPSSTSLKPLRRSIRNSLHPAANKKRSRGVNDDAGAGSRATKVIMRQNAARTPSDIVRDPRRSKRPREESQYHSRDAYHGQRKAHQAGLATSFELRGKRSIVSESESYENLGVEEDSPKEGRWSTIIPSRLVRIANVLREWISKEANSTMLAVQRRLSIGQYPFLVLLAMQILCTLTMLHLKITTTNSSWPYVGAILLSLAWNSRSLRCGKCSHDLLSIPASNAVSARL